MVLVKCCGLTRLEDAQLCMDAGADYLGVIRVEGTPRFQSLDFLEQVVLLSKKYETARVVAVYQNAPIDMIVNDVVQSDVDFVQLHGDEDLAYVQALYDALADRAFIWKVFNVLDLPSVETLEAYNAYILGAVFDVPKSHKESIDWESIPFESILDATEDMKFICVLAGKLTAENLPEVLTRFWLSVVDVASGIENPETGFKDKKKQRRL
jgi:indole-3-glycerol phosphate synthase/phosphoribosylanthranilate isomerase